MFTEQETADTMSYDLYKRADLMYSDIHISHNQLRLDLQFLI